MAGGPASRFFPFQQNSRGCPILAFFARVGKMNSKGRKASLGAENRGAHPSQSARRMGHPLWLLRQQIVFHRSMQPGNSFRLRMRLPPLWRVAQLFNFFSFTRQPQMPAPVDWCSIQTNSKRGSRGLRCPRWPALTEEGDPNRGLRTAGHWFRPLEQGHVCARRSLDTL